MVEAAIATSAWWYVVRARVRVKDYAKIKPRIRNWLSVREIIGDTYQVSHKNVFALNKARNKICLDKRDFLDIKMSVLFCISSKLCMTLVIELWH